LAAIERWVTSSVRSILLIRYQSRRDDDGPLREKLRELAHQRHRFGYHMRADLRNMAPRFPTA
jgi:hypothetical protein